MAQIDEYKALLKKALDNLPSSVHEKGRFEIPKVMGHIQGNKTIISNFRKIADTLRRDVTHLLKYILKGLATPGAFRGHNLVLGAKVSASMINAKIRQYAEEFVLCRECGKPDTKLIKEGQIVYLRCQACGAKYTVKSKI